MKNKDEHPPINFGKTGVLIINLGTPDSTSWLDIRKYLKEFLSDRRVIEVNPIIWQFILNVFILTFRPSKSGIAYIEIWKYAGTAHRGVGKRAYTDDSWWCSISCFATSPFISAKLRKNCSYSDLGFLRCCGAYGKPLCDNCCSGRCGPRVQC